MSTWGPPGKMGDNEQTHINNMELQDVLEQTISDNTGLSLEDVKRLWSRDTYYDAEDSLTLGFIDEIIEPKSVRKLKPGSRSVPEHLYPENRATHYYASKQEPS